MSMVTHEDDVFDYLVAQFIKEYLEFNPIVGTHLGLHEYDSLIPEVSKDRMMWAIQRLEWFYNKFREIDSSKLTGFRRIDYEPVVRSVEEALILLRDWPTWRMYPIGFDTVGGAIYPLLI
ncbi:MAG TPA: hypothetical protein ENF93_02225, partial [Ignisphaera sp.]|nr:hypothetical protein [Ignisphaera sp.]